jgi:hypothetical protein
MKVDTLVFSTDLPLAQRPLARGAKMNSLLNKCPVCGGDLVVTRLHCLACETTIEGNFDAGASRAQDVFTPEQLKPLMPFSRLSAEQLQFILTFVRCEGRFNRMEDEMGLSYPTLRNRLNDIIRAMGYEPSREETPAGPPPPGPAERQSILDMLSKGEIDLEEAKRRLRGERAAE